MYYATSVQKKSSLLSATNFGYGYGYGYRRYGAWGGIPNNYTNVSEYTEGTLIIDFVDAKTRKLVFRGIGKGTMGDPKQTPSILERQYKKLCLHFQIRT